MAELLDDDLMLVNRSGKSYKATGADLKSSIVPPAEIARPSIVSPSDGAGINYVAESDEIISVSKFPPAPYEFPSVRRSPNEGSTWNDSTNSTIFTNSTEHSTTYKWMFDVQDPEMLNKAISFTVRAGLEGKLGFYGTDAPDKNPVQLHMNISTIIYIDGKWYIDGIYQSDCDFVRYARVRSIDSTTRYYFTVISTYQELTFSGPKSLSGLQAFEQGDSVTQDSGYQRETDTIVTRSEVQYATVTDVGTLTYNGGTLQEVFNGTTTGGLTVGANVNDPCDQTNYREITWLHPIENISKLEVYCANNINSGSMNLWLNGDKARNICSDINSAYHDLTSLLDGGTTLSKLAFTKNNGGQTASGDLKMIKVNGKPIIINYIDQYELTFASDKDLNNYQVGDKAIYGTIFSDNIVDGTSPQRMFDGIDGGQYNQNGCLSNKSNAPFTWSAYGEFDGIETCDITYATYNAPTNPLRINNKVVPGVNTNSRADVTVRATFGAGGNYGLNLDTIQGYAGSSTATTYINVKMVKVNGLVLVDSDHTLVTHVDVANKKMLVEKSPAATDSFTVGATVQGQYLEAGKGTIISTIPNENKVQFFYDQYDEGSRFVQGVGKFIKTDIKPSANAAPSADNFRLRSTDFQAYPSGTFTHESSDWQITLSTDVFYALPVDQTSENSGALTQWAPNGIEAETQYRARMRHRAQSTVSEWSKDVVFKTAATSVRAQIGDPFFDANRNSIIAETDVHLSYGIDPIAEPERAEYIGIYPIENVQYRMAETDGQEN